MNPGPEATKPHKGVRVDPETPKIANKRVDTKYGTANHMWLAGGTSYGKDGVYWLSILISDRLQTVPGIPLKRKRGIHKSRQENHMWFAGGEGHAKKMNNNMPNYVRGA